jgi:hypothetical protein
MHATVPETKRSSLAEQINVFEPDDAREAAEGWALHTTRRRTIHEAEARRLDRLRQYLGTLAAILAALAGTSAFAAWESNRASVALGVVTALVGIGAAILGSVLTFLDLGARAEAHRRAAAAYKDVLREFEDACGTRPNSNAPPDREALRKLKELMHAADKAAPVVPYRLARKVEQQPFRFVGTADELSPNRPPPPEPLSRTRGASPAAAPLRERRPGDQAAGVDSD